MNDGTIGSPVSGSQSRSNDDCWPLFNLLWNVSNDEWCTVYATGTLTRTGRGSSALADWNAARHIALPKMYGRVPGSAGWGSGLSNFSVATWGGLEYVALGQEHTPPHSHSFSAVLGNHSHGLDTIIDNLGPSSGDHSFGTGTGNLRILNKTTDPGGAANISGSTSTFGGGTPHYNVQPTTYLYYFIKL
jgi:microcystin-dependent protein